MMWPSDSPPSAAGADGGPAGVIPPGPGRLRLVWHRRGWVLGLVALGLVAAFVYLACVRNVYVSTSVLSVREGVGLTGSGEGAPASGDVLYTEAQGIRSTEALSAAARLPEVRDAARQAGDDNPLRFLADSVEVQVDRVQGTISVSAQASVPASAALVVNEVVSAWLTRRCMAPSRPAGAGRAAEPPGPVAQPPAAVSPAGLKGAARQELEEFIRANPEFISQESAESLGTQLAKLSDALTAARLEAIDAKAALDSLRPALADRGKMAALVRSFRPKGIFGPLDAQTDQIEGEVAPLEKQRALQSTAVGPNNPAVVALQTKISALRARAGEIEARKADILKANLEQRAAETAQRLAGIEALVEIQKKLVREHVETAGRYERLREQLNLEMASAGDEPAAGRPAPGPLVGRQAVVPADGTGSGVTVKVTRGAVSASAPVWPRRPYVVAAGALAGLLAGLGLAWVRWPWRGRGSLKDRPGVVTRVAAKRVTEQAGSL